MTSEQRERGGPDQASRQPYTVVVGVSATSKSPTALSWGYAQAQLNGGRMIAVRIWRMPNPQATPAGTPASRVSREGEVESLEWERLERDVAETLGPNHQAELRLVRGGKRKALIEQAEDADLLVIDAPRAPSASPMLAQRIVYDASCPVVVMPPRISGQPPGMVERAGKAVGRSAVRSAGMAGRPGYRPPMGP